MPIRRRGSATIVPYEYTLPKHYNLSHVRCRTVERPDIEQQETTGDCRRFVDQSAYNGVTVAVIGRFLGQIIQVRARGNRIARREYISRRIYKLAAGNASVIIPNDTDFDTIQTYGLRSVKNTEAARTMTNMPVVTGGLLIVLPIISPTSPRCSQIFMTNSGDVTIFIRRKTSDTEWGSWAEIAKVSQ